jgi:hypothetical protein
MTTPVLLADGLVSLFGAAGALVIAGELRRGDPSGAVLRRVVFALRYLAAFCLLRAVAWLSADGYALTIVDVVAAGVPLVALIVAEGLLRRHAPRLLKLVLVIAPVVVLAANLIPFMPRGIYVMTLLGITTLGMAAVAWLLWSRDVGSLSQGENLVVRRLLGALLLLTPLIVTDFRAIWPDIPVRSGALGVLLLLYLGLGATPTRQRVGVRLTGLMMLAGVAFLFALGHTLTNQGSDHASTIRAGVVGLAGLLFAALFSESQGARAERARPSDALFEARTCAEFETHLTSHPIFGSVRFLSGPELEHLTHPEFASLLEANPVLPRAKAPWGRTKQDSGAERALSLLVSHDATHLMLLSREPLRLAVVTVPATAIDTRTENDLAIARRLAEQLYAPAARPAP